MKTEFNKLSKRANLAISNLKSKEDDLLEFFQPFFDEDIGILYQEADGFVILHNRDCDNKNYSNLNTGIKEAFENIQKDENFYKKQKVQYS
jgi:hypothetical protein